MAPICTAAQGVSVWRAEYFGNPTLAGLPILERNESAIDYDWQGGAPDDSLPPDGFSARWTAYLLFEPGTYTFEAYAEGGVRLWIDAQLLIGQWQTDVPAQYERQVVLTAGYHVVRMEYRHSHGDATTRLRWEEQPEEDASNQGPPASSENPQSAAEPVKTLTTAPAPLAPFDPNVLRRVGGPNESAFEWSRGYKGQLFYDVPEGEPHDGS